jgi:hypothetical protein
MPYRTEAMPNFRELFLETVWKIAEGLSSGLFDGKKRPIGAHSTPLESLRNPHFGTHSDFPNSFSTHFGV